MAFLEVEQSRAELCRKQLPREDRPAAEEERKGLIEPHQSDRFGRSGADCRACHTSVGGIFRSHRRRMSWFPHSVTIA